MKKLMLVLAAIGIGVSVHAASVYWTCTNVKDGEGNAISGVAYLVDAATLSQEAFTALSGADAFATALASSYSYTPAIAGKYSIDATSSIDNATLGLEDATRYSVYLAIFDSPTITDTSKYYLTEVKDLTTFTGFNTQQVKWGTQASRLPTVGWSSVSGGDGTPEPTSGLLMLVGGAMLALRRKRA